jgi:hypothetical protein
MVARPNPESTSKIFPGMERGALRVGGVSEISMIK